MRLSSLSSILVNIGEGCTVGCAHCGFNGSPRQRKIDATDLASWITQACHYGIPMVIFTGGEVFEDYPLLRRGVQACHAAGGQSALFTSSSWAADRDDTQKQLSELPGLTSLYLSSDIYHQARVPYQNVFNVIEAADKLEIPDIKICIHYGSEADLQDVRSHYTKYGDRLEFFEERVMPTSKNQFLFESIEPPRGLAPAEYETSCWMETPYINAGGEVFACHIGGADAHGDYSDLPHWIGSLTKNSFAGIMDAAAGSAVYQFLRTHGPRGVAEFVRECPELVEGMPRDRFHARCDMCFAVLSVPSAARALREYVQRPSVLANINILLLARFGETPIQRQ